MEPMLPIKNRRTGSRIDDDHVGLNMNTTEQKIASGVERAWTWLRWIVTITVIASAAWFTLGAKVNAIEKDVAILAATKQSKEVAEGDQRVIVTKLEEFEKRMTQRLEAIEKELAARPRRER
jgi:hypothetical protein